MCALLLLAILAGCERGGPRLLSEEDEPSYRRATSLVREGRYDEALIAYSRVVNVRADAPESHLAMGQLYLDYLKDPVSAIYHFNQFLALKPNTERSKLVKSLIDTSKKEFARSLPGDPFGDDFDRLDLLDKIDELRAETVDLKRQLAAANQELEQLRANRQVAATQRATTTQASQQSSTQTRPQATFAPPRPQVASDRQQASGNVRSYVVQGGDTLSSVSRKVYGSPARWRDIFEANRDLLRNPNDLKVGQELKIPE